MTGVFIKRGIWALKQINSSAMAPALLPTQVSDLPGALSQGLE